MIKFEATNAGLLQAIDTEGRLRGAWSSDLSAEQLHDLGEVLSLSGDLAECLAWPARSADEKNRPVHPVAAGSSSAHR